MPGDCRQALFSIAENGRKLPYSSNLGAGERAGGPQVLGKTDEVCLIRPISGTGGPEMRIGSCLTPNGDHGLPEGRRRGTATRGPLFINPPRVLTYIPGAYLYNETYEYTFIYLIDPLCSLSLQKP